MNKPLTRFGLALTLCSGLALSGCGDDENDNPTTPSSPAPVEPSPAPSAAPTPSPEPTPPPTGQVGQRVNFLGRLKTVDGSQLKIGSQIVLVDANTTYDRGGTPVPLDNFQIGEILHVRGTVMDDGSILATRINIPAPTDDTSSQ
jgi:hypothetical protein